MRSRRSTPWLLLGGCLLAALVWVGCSPATKVAPSRAAGSATLGNGSTSHSASSTLPVIKHNPAKPFPDMVDLCLILSGQMYGYLQPCGCSRPQVGGLERRYDLMKRFLEHGYSLSAADLGDLPVKGDSGAQSRWKYEMAVKSLKTMSYSAIGLGPTEFGMQLETVLALAQNYQPPAILAANLLDPDTLYPDMFRAWTIDDPRRREDDAVLVARLHGLFASPASVPQAVVGAALVSGRPRVGYLGLLGESALTEIKKKDTTSKLLGTQETLTKTLPSFLEAKPELRILLLQGTESEAKQILEKHPGAFQVILCRNDDLNGVAPLMPLLRTNSGALILAVGAKGRSVGVVGYRRGKPLEYRLEELVEELELPDAKTNPAREVMKEYVWGVYRNNYLRDTPKISHPMQLDPELQGAVFIGAATCKQCHPTAHNTWTGSHHSHAWETLIKLARPIAEVPQKDMPPKMIGRQFDPDCVKCHVTGYGYKGGFIDEIKTPYLFGNGCENCHGPGSMHAAQPFNTKYSKPLNLDIVGNKGEIERKCRTCHDLDNDPHFHIDKWEKIKHGKER